MALWGWDLGFDWNSVEGDGDNQLLMEGLVDFDQVRGRLHNPKPDWGYWSCPASPMWIQAGDYIKFNLYNLTSNGSSDMQGYKLRKVHVHFKNSLGGTPAGPVEQGDLTLNPAPVGLHFPDKLYHSSIFSVIGEKAFPLWELKWANGEIRSRISTDANGKRFIMTATVIIEKIGGADDGKLKSFYVDPEMAVGGMNT